MADMMARLDEILADLTGGLSFKVSRPDWDYAMGKLLQSRSLEEAGRVWELAAGRFSASLMELVDAVTDDAAQACLEGLLFLMKVKLRLDPDFRKNILNFPRRSVQYLFCSRSRGVKLLIEFADGDLRRPVSDGWAAKIWARLLFWWDRPVESGPPDVTLEFKNSRALMTYLFKYGVLQDRDLLASLLKNEVRTSGNVNYLFKFAFMANHMLLEVSGKLR